MLTNTELQYEQIMMISVIIPIYNKEKYIRTILNQIKTQSFEDFECLLIDDGSTDDSGVACDEFAQSDHRFKTFHIENNGVSHARNLGLSMATGKYITFIDSDDEIHIDYLKNLYECISNNNVDLVIGSYTKIWDNTNKTEEIIYHNLQGIHSMKDLLSDFAPTQSKYGIYGWCWSKIFPKSLLEGTYFNEELNLAEDFDFYLDLYPKINSVYIDDKPYYYYRQKAENSLINSADDSIDYYAQLLLNLKFMFFLVKMNSFSGNNAVIVNTLLSNYTYFALFHSSLSEYETIFTKVRTKWKEYHYLLTGFNFSSKIILHCVKTNALKFSKAYLRVYRFARNIKRAIKSVQQ